MASHYVAYAQSEVSSQTAERPAHILLVDDELVQIETLRRGLLLFGYYHHCACNALDALGYLKTAQNPPVDLLITDLTMPDCSGLQLIKEVLDQNPTLPIIVITGLAVNQEIDEIRQRGHLLLAKPFTPEELDKAICCAWNRRETLTPSAKLPAGQSIQLNLKTR